MSNYTPISFDYDKTGILNAIENYQTFGARPCTKTEINKINNVIKLKYYVQDMLYFSMGPNNIGEIHIDENLLKKETTHLSFAVNLPLLNTNKVKMSWWTKKDFNQQDEYNLGVYNAKFKILHQEHADCLDYVFYTLPTIVNVSDYHNVSNSSDKPAHFISLRFDSEVTREMLIDSISNLDS